MLRRHNSRLMWKSIQQARLGITKGIHRMHAQKRQERSGDTHFLASKRERSAMKIL
ncbi:Uncharacterised protein [Vibrio cholerae]|nr:Uncharacterised protein [Vibrio cholerae]